MLEEVLERIQAVGLGFFRGVAEQPVLAPLLFVDLYGRLICMDDILLEEALLQSRDERHGRVLDGEMLFLAAGEALEGFAAVVDDLDLGGDELNFRAELLFAHGRQGHAATLADVRAPRCTVRAHFSSLRLRLVEKVHLLVCSLQQNPLRPFRAGPIDHLLQPGNLGLEHLDFCL